MILFAAYVKMRLDQLNICFGRNSYSSLVLVKNPMVFELRLRKLFKWQNKSSCQAKLYL